ncbi:hypothetical protein [Sinorhizobium meliloti]|nr:hypothetical protein [Sinorhizobium meliloti]
MDVLLSWAQPSRLRREKKLPSSDPTKKLDNVADNRRENRMIKPKKNPRL